MFFCSHFDRKHRYNLASHIKPIHEVQKTEALANYLAKSQSNSTATIDNWEYLPATTVVMNL